MVGVETQRTAIEAPEHMVEFYDHDSELAGVVTATFAAEHEAPGRARRLVAARLRQWGHDETLVQDAALISSELATNAVIHAGSTFSITVRVEDSILRIAVGDAYQLAARSGEGLPPRRGHGLGLVDALSARWGVEGTSDGKVVWAELEIGA